jgi:DNA-binding NarL/FixJ family response regulator
MGERVPAEQVRSGSSDKESVGRPGRLATMPIRVVIVDDHALVREGTLQLLEQEADVEVVGQAGSGEEGLDVLGRLRPDVALIDVNLPGMSGLELARAAAGSLPEVRVLIVSAYDDYAYVAEALEIGVSGYLLKTASARELVDAVRAVASGVFVLDRAVSGRLARRRRSGAPGAGALTPRETDVLGLLARGRSNKQIAAELGLGLRTVEGHVSSVLGKLGVASRTEAVAYALGHRLVVLEDHGGSSDTG